MIQTSCALIMLEREFSLEKHMGNATMGMGILQWGNHGNHIFKSITVFGVHDYHGTFLGSTILFGYRSKLWEYSTHRQRVAPLATGMNLQYRYTVANLDRMPQVRIWGRGAGGPAPPPRPPILRPKFSTAAVTNPGSAPDAHHLIKLEDKTVVTVELLYVCHIYTC